MMLRLQSNRCKGNPAMHKTQGIRHKIAQFTKGCGGYLDLVAQSRPSVVFAACA